jgi:hypothetical protein
VVPSVPHRHSFSARTSVRIGTEREDLSRRFRHGLHRRGFCVGVSIRTDNEIRHGTVNNCRLITEPSREPVQRGSGQTARNPGSQGPLLLSLASLRWTHALTLCTTPAGLRCTHSLQTRHAPLSLDRSVRNTLRAECSTSVMTRV